MPMRSELADPTTRSGDVAAVDDGLWVVIGLCAIGLLLSINLAVYVEPVDQIPILIAQYNLW